MADTMELAVRYDGTDLTSAEAVLLLEEIERQRRYLEKCEKQLKNSILSEMERTNTIKLENEHILVSYIGAADRESFDSKAFRADYADLYDEYVRFSTVSPFIRITMRARSQDKIRRGDNDGYLQYQRIRC